VDDRQVKRSSPFSIFVKSRFASGDFHNMKVTECIKLIAAEWKALSAAEKKVSIHHHSFETCTDLYRNSRMRLRHKQEQPHKTCARATPISFVSHDSSLDDTMFVQSGYWTSPGVLLVEGGPFMAGDSNIPFTQTRLRSFSAVCNGYSAAVSISSLQQWQLSGAALCSCLHHR
jgi:hypothetical protein